MSGLEFQVGDKVTRINPNGAWEAKCLRHGYKKDGIFTVGRVSYKDDPDDMDNGWIWITEICEDLNNNWDNWGANKFQLASIDLDEDDNECI